MYVELYSYISITGHRCSQTSACVPCSAVDVIDKARTRIDGNFHFIAISTDHVGQSVAIKVCIRKLCKGSCLRSVETERDVGRAKDIDARSQSCTPSAVG